MGEEERVEVFGKKQKGKKKKKRFLNRTERPVSKAHGGGIN